MIHRMDYNSLLYIIVYVLAIIFYIVFFVWASKNAPTGDSSNNWNDIKADVFSSWIAPSVALICSGISFYYLNRYPDYFIWIVMALACLAVGFGVAALSFALISR